jgi:hypothetical protein
MNQNLIRNRDGSVMFYCSDCGEPLAEDDFYDQGMRLPEHGETRDEYCDAELLDGTTHNDCLRGRNGR